MDEQVAALNQFILARRTLEAIERFYADDVTIQENGDLPRVRQSRCFEQERQNIQNVQSVQATPLNQAIHYKRQVVFNEWPFSFTKLGGQRATLMEVSVPQW